MPTQRISSETHAELRELVDEETTIDLDRLSFDELVGAAVDVVEARRDEAEHFEEIAKRKQRQVREAEARADELEERIKEEPTMSLDVREGTPSLTEDNVRFQI
jgi:cell fate (sporulation/competence/biofilm development) regulator YmcA (YheA/YmcA/DUF963 family)